MRNTTSMLNSFMMVQYMESSVASHLIAIKKMNKMSSHKIAEMEKIELVSKSI
jgi:hypothetical protein